MPNPQKVCLQNGFDTNHIYELIYTAQNPIVMGLGLAALRDVSAFFHNSATDDNGTVNPLAGQIAHTMLRGDLPERSVCSAPFSTSASMRTRTGNKSSRECIPISARCEIT